MPYSTNDELPPSVRDHLPPHAQDIYREAFNHAWQKYKSSARHEEIAHRVAWAAVKRLYEKREGIWSPISGAGTISDMLRGPRGSKRRRGG